MKRATILIIVILSIYGCGDSRNIQERKNRLMFDCQCDPGTYEYSYKISGLLIEEQNNVKNYMEKNKQKFLECTGMKDSDHRMLIKVIDDGIKYNEAARPYYATQLFFGKSKVGDITDYKEAQLDLIVKELEISCEKLKIKN